MQHVVISGACGGMGFATSKKLIESGYHVFGLDVVEPTERIEGFTFIKTDIRDLKSVESAFEIVKKETETIDTVISFAGIYDMNSLIEMSEEDFIEIFDINLFGIYRLNKLFVPLLKEKGKVIITSSELAPLDPLPFTGIYGITKSTVEKYAYSLRMELQLLNKQVVVIRPGAVNTNFIKKSNVRIEHFTDNTEMYKYNAARFMEIITSVESKNISTDKIAKLVDKILKKNKPKYIYKINRNPLLILLNILPKRMQNWIIKKILLSKSKKKGLN